MNKALFEFTKNHKVGFFGIGKTNLALLWELSGSGVEITLRSDGKIDRAELPDGLNISAIYEGEDSTKDISEDILFFSPSVRRDRCEFLAALERGTVFSSDIELFLYHNRAPLFLVTGSDGKTTTVTLVERMLKAGGKDAIAIGNVGRAAVPLLEKTDTKFVLEASSFMLEYVSPESERAAITSLTPEHLSWHRGYDGYKRAKMRAFENAKECVASLDSPDLCELIGKRSFFALTSTTLTAKEMIRSFNAEYYYYLEDGHITENGRRLINIADLKRREEYNTRNYLSSLALTRGYACEDDALAVIRDFSGTPHRCETFLERGGIRFINSSIDTSPERSATTVKGLSGRLILLLGGRDKGLMLDPLLKVLDERIKAVLLFGEVGEKFGAALPENINKQVFKSLSDATARATEIAKRGDTVLLSPAAASYDEFSDFEARGDFFKKTVLHGF